jgi:hypothetical protein
MKRLYLSVAIEMPPSPFDASDIYAKIKAPWGDLLNSLQASGVEYDAKVDEMEMRAKAKRAARKPRLVANSGPPLGSGHDVSAA